MEPALTVLFLILFVGLGFVGYKIVYPSEVSIVNAPTLKLAEHAPIQLIGPSTIPLTSPGPLTITPHPTLKFDPIPALKFEKIPELAIHTPDAIPINYGTTPTFQLNAPKSMDLIAPSSINLLAPAPLRLEEIPKLKFEAPPTILMAKGDPCEFIGPNYRDVGPDCFKHIWRNMGCLKDNPYVQWHKDRTRSELETDSRLWATIDDETHRLGCYGDRYPDISGCSGKSCPVSDTGRCGPNFNRRCPNGTFCSHWNWCGSSAAHKTPTTNITYSGYPIKTTIWVQADDKVEIKVNGNSIGIHNGWKPLGFFEIDTMSQDIITFHVSNTSGPGGLKATIKRGNLIARTGNADFRLDGAEQILVKTTGWKWAVDGPWGSDDIAINPDHTPGEWIWNKNLCESCTVVFKYTIP